MSEPSQFLTHLAITRQTVVKCSRLSYLNLIINQYKTIIEIMKEFQLGNFIAYEVSDIADTLREIADRIDEGYTSGITNAEGVCWSIGKNEEE